MTRIIFIPLLLLCTVVCAQPAGYVPGTQVCWPIHGFDHGYFKAAGNGERHILLAFTGYGEKSCLNYQHTAPTNLLDDLGLNWDGRTVRAPGDTIVWEVLTVPNYAEMWIPDYARNIDSFFKNIASIDTSDHSRFHIAGLSHGVGRFWNYLDNKNNHNSPYRHIFSTTISLSGQQQDSNVIKRASQNRRNWVWVGEDDYGQTSPGVNLYNYNYMARPKSWTLQLSTPTHTAEHNWVTWDSCWSIKGTDSAHNRWIWMVTQPDTTTPTPICPISGGPANYVAATQVPWVFNGRQHGYFRAAGCGERHILIAFTGNSITDTTNYQLYSPQKLLEDAGINWNGRTVRAPGDTVVWEVLTIANTSNNWLQDYSNDINYFLEHIEAIDTSDHNLFHIAGVGHGANRMWGYLTNDQNNYSPYRHIFSTTISVSATWFNIYPKISDYSAGKRHWVWHGSLDSSGSTPPSVATSLYNALNGDKRVTLQSNGGHNAITWDSCFSRAGADTSNNRWLWMVIPPASGLRSFVNSPAPAQKAVADVIEGNSELKAWPNPATGTARLTWKGKTGIAYRITVSDRAGRLRKTNTGIRGHQHTLDLSGLDKGLHFVQIEGGGEKFMLKLIVN